MTATFSEASGVAGIKPAYIKANHVDEDALKNHEPKPNSRGRNKRSKKYKRAKHSELASILCPSLWFTVPEEICKYVLPVRNCKLGPEKCMHNHDLKEFWSKRQNQLNYDIPCAHFQQRGWCNYGFACISAEDHTDMELLTCLYDKEKVISWHQVQKTNPSLLNCVDREVVFGLAKRKYDFKDCREFIKEYKSSLVTEETQQFNEIASPELISSQVVFNDVEFKPLDVKDKLVLAPLTTVGNLPFRRICVALGADVTCAEMCMSTSLLAGNPSEWALVKRHSSEKMFGIQLCGGHYDSLYMATHVLANHTKFDFVDLNLGCPIDLVCQKGGGCSMMTKVGRLNSVIDVLHSLLAPYNIPITVKMRTGLQADRPIAHKIIKKYCHSGKVSLFTLHGRSKEQRYTKSADWAYIKECAKVAHPVPLLGCGDVLNYEQYYQHMDEDASGISGVMIARGALVKPWIFSEIREKRHFDISSNERLDILKDFVKFGLEHWGSDRKGIENTRRFLLEWLSFLHRYIPVGILEYLPQKMNLKPPPYFGRNELETLMSSDNCEDWVKITEILLGPTPETFEFVPKHKANSYSNHSATVINYQD